MCIAFCTPCIKQYLLYVSIALLTACVALIVHTYGSIYCMLIALFIWPDVGDARVPLEPFLRVPR